MINLNIWIILFLLAAADWGGYGHGRAAVDGSVITDLLDGFNGGGKDSPCREDKTSGVHSRVFQLYSSNQSFPEAKLVLNGSSSEVVPIGTDLCPGDLSACENGFTVALWLRPQNATVGDEGVYYLSSGAQRPESDGFYLRLDSVEDPQTGFPLGTFSIGVATMDRIWHVRYQATMDQMSHVIMSWRQDIGLDVYVDGLCVGAQTDESYQRVNVTSSCCDDPFPYLYVGRRNDFDGGFARADIRQITIWDAWKNPFNISDLEDEDVLQIYFEGCKYTKNLSTAAEPPPVSTPQECMVLCKLNYHKYVLITEVNNTPVCICRQSDTISDRISSCNTCDGYTKASCGGNNSVSVYRLPSLRSAISDPLAITGFTVSIDGIVTPDKHYTVIESTNINISFSVVSGENIFYSIYENDILLAGTYMTTTYLTFTRGQHNLMARATNEINTVTNSLWITAVEDTRQIDELYLEIQDKVIATSETETITLEVFNGSPKTCELESGDGSLAFIFDTLVSTVYYTATVNYTTAGVFTAKAICTNQQYTPFHAFTRITVQDRVSISLNSTFKIPQGINLTIPFQITGTNITDRAVLYDGQPMPYITCLETNCEMFIGVTLTSQTGIHILDVKASNLISGLVTSRSDIYVGAPLTNFSSTISQTAVEVREWVTMTAFVESGAPCNFFFKFGQREHLSTCETAPCKLSYNNSFSEAGHFKVFVEVSNEISSLKSEIHTVKVYNLVPPLKMVASNSSSTVRPVVLAFQPLLNTSPWPTDARVVFSLASIQGEFEEDFSPFLPGESTADYYLSIPVVNHFNLTVHVFNAISSLTFQNIIIQVGESITGFSGYLVPSTQAAGEDIILELRVETGSELTFVVDFGDDSNTTLKQDNKVSGDNLTIHRLFSNSTTSVHSSSTITLIRHMYEIPGVYAIKYKALNAFSEAHGKLSVNIINGLNGLKVNHKRVESTGSPVDVVVYLAKGVQTPQMAHCLIDYNDGQSADRLSANLSEFTNLTAHHTYITPKLNYEVTVFCHNVVSNVTIQFSLDIHQPISGCSLSASSQAVPVITSVDYTIQVNGSDVLLNLTFGDGSRNATLITGEDHITQKVYTKAGFYRATLYASNPISECMAYGIPVTVQIPVPDDGYQLSINPGTISISNLTLLSINFDKDLSVPTNVTALWDFGDGTSHRQVIPQDTRDFNISHKYNKVGTYDVSLNLSNLVSYQVLIGTVIVLEPIRGIEFDIGSITAEVSANITLWILPTSGSSITYNIDYGDGCIDNRFQDQPQNESFIFSYDAPGTYVLTIHAWNNLSSILSNHTEIRVLYPVRGLSLEVCDGILYPGLITFYISIDNGVPSPSEMECTWEWGTGEPSQKMNDVIIQDSLRLAENHVYHGGHFLVDLNCSNALGRVNLKTEIDVFENITDLEIFCHALVVGVDSKITFEVSMKSGSLVEYLVQFGDGQHENRSVLMASKTKIQMFQHTFDTPGTFHPSVSASNRVGSSNATFAIEVMHSTYTLELSSDSPMKLPDSLITFLITSNDGLKHPLYIKVEWYFGDGVNETFERMDFDENHSIGTTHQYKNSGSYQAYAHVYNKLDNQRLNTTVFIKPEVDVSLKFIDDNGSLRDGFGPQLNWFPSGFELQLAANFTQNVTFQWNFGNGEEVYTELVKRKYYTPGIYNITLQFRKGDSAPQEMHYFAYIVGPFNLLHIEAVGETEQEIFIPDETVDLSLLGSGLTNGNPLCITWDVGYHAQQIVYGPEACKTLMKKDNSSYTPTGQAEGTNLSYVFTSPGYHHINVSVTSFLSTAHITREFTVKGCLCPPEVFIRGPGDSNIPRVHVRSEVIQLEASVSAQCFGLAPTTFTWRVYDHTERLLPITLENNYQLDFSPGLLDVGLHLVLVDAQVEGYSSKYDMALLRIDPSPLVLAIEGGSGRAVGKVNPLTLNALTSSYDPDDPTSSIHNWTINWSCQIQSNFSNTDLLHLCDNLTSWEQLNNTDPVINLDASRLRQGAEYVFRVEVVSGSRSASYEQTVWVLEGIPPVVSISCISNCAAKINPTTSFLLQGACSGCDAGKAVFDWSLFVREHDSKELRVISDLESITSTGSDNQGIAFYPNTLEGGREYMLQLNVSDRIHGRGFIQHSFITNLPPYDGSCSITPTTGYAISTEFSITCSGWLDEGHSLSRTSISPDLASVQFLRYRVMTRVAGETKFLLKTSGTQRAVPAMLLELGQEEFGYTHEVMVNVLDAYGAVASVNLTVEVRPPSLREEELLSLFGSNTSQVSFLVSSGDTQGAFQLITAILSVLPTVGNTSLIELRSELVSTLSRVSVWGKTVESLLQGSSTLSNSMTGHVNDKALLDASEAMLAMAMTLQGVDSNDVELVITTASEITAGLGMMIVQSDGLVQDALGTSEAGLEVSNFYGDDISPEDAVEQTARYNEEKKVNIQNAQMVARTISTLARQTINHAVDVVMDKRVLGQPPLRLDSDSLIVEVYKGKPDSIANQYIQSDAGSFRLPDAYSLFGERDDIHVEQTVLFFNSNPFSFSESSASIGSKCVLTMEFTDGDRNPLVVRNLTNKISIILQTDEGKVESQRTLKTSFKSISEMQYQKVELTEENVELRVFLKDVSDETSRFLIYLRNGSFPDEKTHDAVQSIPRILKAGESWDDNAVKNEAEYTAVFPIEVLNGVGNYYLGVVLMESMVLNDTSSLAGSKVVNVTLLTYASGCRYWDTHIEAWSSEGCEAGPLTNLRYTHCLCNHLSSFAASFFVPPNSIDFSTVFTKDLGDNAAVFSTVLGSFGLYLILLVWLRRKDRQDIIKWGVCPLADNHPKDSYFYQVTVSTGLGPESGTRSKVSLILSTDDADSGVRLLDDNKRKIFERGSVCHFLMSVARPLGNLSHIKVWHDNTGSGESASWYLSQVSITDLQTRQQFFFVCDRWLAVEKEDGAVERVIPVATRSDLTQFGKLFYTSSRKDLFDGHIWFSLFSRPTRSTFTRVQRLSCCLCLLYLSMIASAMFYVGQGEERENQSVLRLGPMTFTLQEFYVGFISAMIVVPVNIIIVQLFRKSKPSQTSILPDHLQNTSKGETSENSSPQSSMSDLKGDKVELVPSSKPRNKKTKSRAFLLPHWCVYLAWLLIILSAVTAAFFTVLYSLEWGREKSNEWLVSMLMSLFNSVIIIQPFKVIALAIFLSLLCKKPTRMDIVVNEGFSKDQNQLGDDEEMLHDTMLKGERRGRFCPPPTKAALEEARKKRIKELKMNRILKDTGFYTVFVVVVMFLCFTTRDGLSFHMSQSIRDIFIKNNGAQTATKLNFTSLEKLTPDLFWNWVEEALLPGLYGETYYNGDPMHWRHTRFLSNWQCYRVGPVRLRQLRVKPDPCQIPPDVLTLNPKCHLGYSWDNEDKGNFSVGWQPTNSSQTQPYSTEESSPWIFHDYHELNGVPHFGMLALYSGGGYVAEFGTSKSSALSMAMFLRETGWYDELTRAIFVEFSVFNGNINLFSVVTMLAETLPTGGAVVSSHVNTLRLYHYGDNMAIFTVVFQVLFVAYLIYYFIRLIVKITQAGCKELKNFWTAIELLMLLLSVVSIVMFILRQIFIVNTLQDVKNKDQGEFVNFSHIAKWDELLGYILACVSFLSLIRYMRLLRLNAKMSLLGSTLAYAAKDLFYFSIIWSLVFCAFAQLTYLLFHAIVGSFSTFITTTETLFSMLLGKFDFEALKMAKPIIGGAVFVVYIMTMYMILTNMFITIVTEAFRQLRAKKGSDDATDHEMVEFMIDRFKAFFLRPLQGHSENPLLKAKAKTTSYEDTMDSLEVQVNRIVRFVESNYGDLDIPKDNPSEGSGSPARTLSRITLHSASSHNGGEESPGKQCNRRIFLA
ncbi:polycystin-1-like [Asterias amurensis]|uniref:polycystin-1-like n=1 Tax=Asterias amurensis TaxID=7602 RepID=UPI003AB58320